MTSATYQDLSVPHLADEVEPEADYTPGQEELAELMARIRAGEDQSWILVATGELAAMLQDWPLAVECLRRLDPLSDEALELRRRLEGMEGLPHVPAPPRHVPKDPGELVANVFMDVINPAAYGPRLGRHGMELLAFMSTCLLSTLLFPSLALALVCATTCAWMVWLVVLGLHVRDDAWCNPSPLGGTVADCRDGEQSSSFRNHALALLCVTGPLALGFIGGLGWLLLFSPAAAMLGMLLLMIEPIHALGHGFPFAEPPRIRESAALGFAGLIVAAMGILSGFLAWTGFGGHAPFILTGTITWMFATRCAGLLARRIHLRLSAEARRTTPLPWQFPDLPDVQWTGHSPHDPTPLSA
jgi:hypothetical protein